MDNGTFGSWENLSIAVLVLLSVLFFNRCGNKYLRMSSIVLGLCLGYVLAFVLGKVDMSSLNAGMLTSLNAPIPFKYGIDFNISFFLDGKLSCYGQVTAMHTRTESTQGYYEKTV